jgi:catechol 2,3-dioxygenase-like lactoylglutathione lyase family enzyme
MRGTLSLRVSDVSASVAWYERVFGRAPFFRGVDRSLDGPQSDIAGFDLAGLRLWLAPLSAGQSRDAEDNDRNPTIALMTDRELSSLRAELLARGALVDDTEDVPQFPADPQGVRRGADADFFWVYDLDRHRIEFCRPHS